MLSYLIRSNPLGFGSFDLLFCSVWAVYRLKVWGCQLVGLSVIFKRMHKKTERKEQRHLISRNLLDLSANLSSRNSKSICQNEIDCVEPTTNKREPFPDISYDVEGPHVVPFDSFYTDVTEHVSLSLSLSHRSSLPSRPADGSFLSESPLARPLPVAQRASTVLQNLRPAVARVPAARLAAEPQGRRWNMSHGLQVNNLSPSLISTPLQTNCILVPLRNSACVSWWYYYTGLTIIGRIITQCLSLR